MSALPSAVDNGLNQDDETLGVRDPSEGKPIGFGEGTSTNGAARIGWRANEDKLSEKDPRSKWCRRLMHRSGTRGQ